MGAAGRWRPATEDRPQHRTGSDPKPHVNRKHTSTKADSRATPQTDNTLNATHTCGNEHPTLFSHQAFTNRNLDLSLQSRNREAVSNPPQCLTTRESAINTMARKHSRSQVNPWTLSKPNNLLRRAMLNPGTHHPRLIHKTAVERSTEESFCNSLSQRNLP